MGIIQEPHPPEPKTPDSCDHPACSRPNPPFWCEGCNQLPIDGGIPFMIILGLFIGFFGLKRYIKVVKK